MTRKEFIAKLESAGWRYHNGLLEDMDTTRRRWVIEDRRALYQKFLGTEWFTVGSVFYHKAVIDEDEFVLAVRLTHRR